MTLVHVVLVLVVIAVLMWAVNKFGASFMDATILKIINIFVVVAIVLWLVNMFIPIFDYINIPVGRR